MFHIKINTANGATVNLNLADEEQAQLWAEQAKNPVFQKSITGATIVRECGKRLKCPSCGRNARLVCDCGHTTLAPSCNAKIQQSVSRPGRMSPVFYHLEHLQPDGLIHGGEKLTCFAGKICLTTMVHAAQPCARISVTEIGEQRYNPFAA